MMRLTLRISGMALFSVDLLSATSELGPAYSTVTNDFNYRVMRLFTPPLWIPTARNRALKRGS